MVFCIVYISLRFQNGDMLLLLHLSATCLIFVYFGYIVISELRNLSSVLFWARSYTYDRKGCLYTFQVITPLMSPHFPYSGRRLYAAKTRPEPLHLNPSTSKITPYSHAAHSIKTNSPKNSKISHTTSSTVQSRNSWPAPHDVCVSKLQLFEDQL